MRYLYFTLSLSLLSCVEDNESFRDDNAQSKEHVIEICHNPQSSNHGQICTKECFSPNRGESSFCWTLQSMDCRHPRVEEWQQKNCHFFD